jgi:hypothetical protein
MENMAVPGRYDKMYSKVERGPALIYGPSNDGLGDIYVIALV